MQEFFIFFLFLSLTHFCVVPFFSTAFLSLSLSPSQTTIRSCFHLLDYHLHLHHKPQIPFLRFTLLPLLHHYHHHHHNQHLRLTVTLNLSLKLSMRWCQRSNTANRNSLKTDTASSTSAFRKSLRNANKDDVISRPKQHKRFGVRFRNQILWWLQLEEEVDGWRRVQDFGFAQGKQPYKQTCPRCGGWMLSFFFFFFLCYCLWLLWIWLVAVMVGGCAGTKER